MRIGARVLIPLACAVGSAFVACDDPAGEGNSNGGRGGQTTGGTQGHPSGAPAAGGATGGDATAGGDGPIGSGGQAGEGGQAAEANAAGRGFAGEQGEGGESAGEAGAHAGGTAGSAGELAFTIDFRGMVGAEPFDCASVYTNVGADDSSVRPVDFKFYVHDVRLFDSEGTAVAATLDQDELWQYQNVALLDFEDDTSLCSNGTAPTNTTIRGSVPAGSYRGIAFVLGVPFELNHTDLTATPSPLNLSSLYWSWNLGRLFLSIMTSAETSPSTRFESALHVGSTGCMGDAELGGVSSCEKPNRAEYSFPDFRLGADVLVADLKGALRQSNLKSELCHSFTEDTCRGPFEELGIGWSNGMPTPETQHFIRVEGAASDGESEYVWSLPKGFPRPVVPADNPMSDEKVALGRHLFYDKRLSQNGTQACASCHQQERAFSDGGAVAIGSTAEVHPRNSMSLTNVAYATTLTWANPLLFTLESQALVPMFGTEPVELGLNGHETELLARLRAVSRYGELFAAAYPGVADPFSVENVTRAIASFERTLISGNSPYDRYVYGRDEEALSEQARRGRVLFFSEKFECFHCHSGFNLQDSANFDGNHFPEARFHNTALYNIDGLGAYPTPNTGVHEITGLAADMGRFRAPTLRNVAATAPYMHDGSIATLAEVLDHYAAGGRTISDGPYAGNGSASPLKSNFMIGFTMTPEEESALLAFLESLTDTAFLSDERFSDPWPLPP